MVKAHLLLLVFPLLLKELLLQVVTQHYSTLLVLQTKDLLLRHQKEQFYSMYLELQQIAYLFSPLLFLLHFYILLQGMMLQSYLPYLRSM